MVGKFRMGLEGPWEVGVRGGMGSAVSVASQQIILEHCHPQQLAILCTYNVGKLEIFVSSSKVTYQFQPI